MIAKTVLIDLYVPATGATHQLTLPNSLTVGQATAAAVRLVTTLSQGAFTASGFNLLCDYVSGQAYDLTARILDLGLRNGSKLMLV